MNQMQIPHRTQTQMQNFRNNMLPYPHNPNDPQNIRNKTTVKKQIFHPLIRFNDHHGKQNQYNRSNLIQNLARNSNTVRKQIESYNEQNESEYCANHPDKTAEFMVKIDEQMLTYCKKCATQVASQGFDVHKIVASPIHNLTQPFRSSSNTSLNISSQILLPNISPSRNRQSLITKNSQQTNSKRQQLITLVSSLKQLKSSYLQKSHHLTSICSTFQQQKQTLTHYYSQLISYIQQIRDSHIQAIQQSSVNVIQVCEIQNGQISQTVGEIQEMLDDIQGNVEVILDEVDEKSFVECYDFYRQKEGIFSHRLEELGAEAKPWPCSSQEQVMSKIHSFKTFVNQLHQVHQDQEQDQQSFDDHQAESFIY